MSLAAQNTEKGADFAAQAVAKVAITMNPEVAFPGQKVRLINMDFLIQISVERFSTEWRKTKTKAIALANHGRCKQLNELNKTRSKYM